jgi:tRNA modification GTPase
MHDSETIVALATPSGKGGVAVIRVSGKKTKNIITKITKSTLKPRIATLTNFFGKNDVIDHGLALFFEEPNSFTGEDVLEFHCHGSIIVVELLIQRIVELGCRLAAPGEFSQRAFLNNKIDLVQAEAIADLINSNSVLAAQASIRSLQGKFSSKINQIIQEITDLRIFVEASIDFPDEELELLEDQKVLDSYKSILKKVEKLIEYSYIGNKLRDGIKIVLAGPPNVGKSTLLNVLSGKDIAIVTDIAGTTRDVMRSQIDLHGVAYDLSDTAGIHETSDFVEMEGIKKAKIELEQADHLLWITDPYHLNNFQELEKLLSSIDNKLLDITVVVNKNDIQDVRVTDFSKYTVISISAKTGDGLNGLKTYLRDCYKSHHSTEGLFIARTRHIESAKKAYKVLNNGLLQLNTQKTLDLIAEDLKYAHNYLGEITGAISSDDLLGKIFSSFCIGK